MCFYFNYISPIDKSRLSYNVCIYCFGQSILHFSCLRMFS